MRRVDTVIVNALSVVCDSLSVARMVNEYVVVAELPVSVPEIVPIDESPSKVNPPVNYLIVNYNLKLLYYHHHKASKVND